MSVRTARHLVRHGRDALQHCIRAVNLSRISYTPTVGKILLIKPTICMYFKVAQAFVRLRMAG